MCEAGLHTAGSTDSVRLAVKGVLLAERTLWRELSQKWEGLWGRHLLNPGTQLLAEVPYLGSGRPSPPGLAQPHGFPQTAQLRAHPVLGPGLAARNVEVADRPVNNSNRCSVPSCVGGVFREGFRVEKTVGKALQAEEAACAEA